MSIFNRHGGLLVLAGLVLTSCGDSNAAQRAEPFNVTAEGVARHTTIPLPGGPPDIQIDIILGVRQGPFELRELTVHKFLQIPSRVHDAVYFFEAANGDTLALTAAGTARDITATTSIADENFTIIGGTGRFAGASGTGTIHSDVVFLAQGADPLIATVVKRFEGTIILG